VITGGSEGIRQRAKDVFAVVMDLARFAVKKFRGADDLAAKRGANSLMPEAYAEDREFPRKSLD